MAITSMPARRAAFEAMEAGADSIYCAMNFDIVEAMARDGIPVVGHVDLIPKKARSTGFRAVGKTADEALKVLADVRRYEDAGAFAVEMEVGPEPVATAICAATPLVVISMGSGGGCDVQYLFAVDVLGETTGRMPRHARAYRDLAAEHARLQAERVAAFAEFRRDVETGRFPAPSECVGMDAPDWEAFRRASRPGHDGEPAMGLLSLITFPMERSYSLTGPESQRAIEAGLANADWYRSPVDRKTLKELMKRSDAPALRDTAIWLGLLVAFGAAGVALWGSWWAVPVFIVYGVLYASTSDSRWHECGHGTAFRTRWMNDVIHEFASFLMVRNSVVWRWSHARHHTDTIIVGRDPEFSGMRPPQPIVIGLNFFGIVGAPLSLAAIARNAMGRLGEDEANYVPDSERPKAFRVARIHMAIHGATLIACIATGSILPAMLIGLPRFYGIWLLLVMGLPQHLGLAEDLLDHRLNSRTVQMNRVLRFIYWNMNTIWSITCIRWCPITVSPNCTRRRSMIARPSRRRCGMPGARSCLACSASCATRTTSSGPNCRPAPGPRMWGRWVRQRSDPPPAGHRVPASRSIPRPIETAITRRRPVTISRFSLATLIRLSPFDTVAMISTPFSKRPAPSATTKDGTPINVIHRPEREPITVAALRTEATPEVAATDRSISPVRRTKTSPGAISPTATGTKRNSLPGHSVRRRDAAPRGAGAGVVVSVMSCPLPYPAMLTASLPPTIALTTCSPVTSLDLKLAAFRPRRSTSIRSVLSRTK